MNSYGLTEHADEVLERFCRIAADLGLREIETTILVNHAFLIGLSIGVGEPETAKEIIEKIATNGGNHEEQVAFVLGGPL